MPNRSSFKNHKEYLEYYKKYRKKNRKKMREYNKNYNKEYRKEHGYYNEENWKKNNPEKVKAQRMLNYAIRVGIIERGKCEVCDGENSQGHHDDYSKPLKVKWLCPIHHKEYHLKLDLIDKKRKKDVVNSRSKTIIDNTK